MGKFTLSTLTVFNRKRKEHHRNKGKMSYNNIIESHRKHIRNLSNEQLTDEQITLLSRGLKFIPTPVTTESNIRRELLKDFDLFARRMRLHYIYYGKEREPHPFHVKSDWNPPVQPSVAPGGGTWVFFGWVCAARDSKMAPRSGKNFP